MKAGDALFMPAFTWHSVKSFGDKNPDPFLNKLNMGINTWFNGNVQYQALFEAVMTLLQGGSVGDLHQTKDDTILAESESGRPFEAVTLTLTLAESASGCPFEALKNHPRPRL